MNKQWLQAFIRGVTVRGGSPRPLPFPKLGHMCARRPQAADSAGMIAGPQYVLREKSQNQTAPGIIKICCARPILAWGKAWLGFPHLPMAQRPGTLPGWGVVLYTQKAPHTSPRHLKNGLTGPVSTGERVTALALNNHQLKGESCRIEEDT